ncbi:MAG: YHYH protein, partial [Verrucomicrobiales bacterium]
MALYFPTSTRVLQNRPTTFWNRLSKQAFIVAFLITMAPAHDITGDPGHPHYDRSVKPPSSIAPTFFMAQSKPPTSDLKTPPQAKPFEAFAPRVALRWDEKFLYVENNGLPAHGMMTGITAWQQQVPMPQAYYGDNAWRIPLTPLPAKQSQSIKGHFLRGAIAIAVNGIPIFNPQNNRGEISQEIGELDQWGGHCGRADDYHYHAAPLHLQTVVGKTQPIAFALDGYPIFGLTEPDGIAPATLDECSGHTTIALGYHYHASMKYPYVNGGFHGEVTEREEQVDPQPRAQPVRPDLPPLRGATITGFTASPDEKTFNLRYTQQGKAGSVQYTSTVDGVWKFEFVDASGAKREETHQSPGGAPQAARPATGSAPVSDTRTMPTGAFILRSPEVANGGALPVDYTGDGSSSTLPLEWSGTPAGTKSYALIMHHLDPEGKNKIYWTLYNIPAETKSLAKNSKGVGLLGRNTINDQIGYAPPHSKGPGAKTYILSLYALSAPPALKVPASEVTGEILSTAIKNLTLASSDLSVVYTRSGDSGNNQQAP